MIQYNQIISLINLNCILKVVIILIWYIFNLYYLNTLNRMHSELVSLNDNLL